MLFGIHKSPLIMGILNITPDSFSGDGLLTSHHYVRAALERASQMIADGADLLDIGGESSRPGSVPVSAEEEIRRTAPVIAALRAKFPNVPMAIDTIKATVAEAALNAGATLINDISALQADTAMAALVAQRRAHIVLMHNRSHASSVTHDRKIGGEYIALAHDNHVEDVLQDLMQRAAFAEKAGIARDKIILDPGIGFGKTVEQNLALSGASEKFRKAGYPILLGPSRKSFIGRVLDLAVDDRLEGTAALVAIGAFQGADILRVHDVQFMVRVAKMAAAIKKST